MGYATKKESRFENDPGNFARESFDYTKWQENLSRSVNLLNTAIVRKGWQDMSGINY